MNHYPLVLVMDSALTKHIIVYYPVPVLSINDQPILVKNGQIELPNHPAATADPALLSHLVRASGLRVMAVFKSTVTLPRKRSLRTNSGGYDS